MGTSSIKPLLAAAALLWAAGMPMAAQDEDSAPKAAAKPRHHAAPKAPKPKLDPNIKLTELNSASAQQLKALPGINEDLAARIIAGRPYLSKSNLVTHKILPTGIYESIKQRIYVVPKVQKPKG